MYNNVTILMSTYNGEKYIDKQIDSLLAQEKVSLRILIRDDGSKDRTIEIIERYMEQYSNIQLIKGSNLGYAKSFWWLLQYAPESDYYAFCDQDDIWMPKKLASAIRLISKSVSDASVPIVYTSRVVSVDNQLNIISNNCFNTNRALNVYEAFQKSAYPGCVFVFNRTAQRIAKRYDGILESHDWALYAIVSMFGKTVYDNDSYINYRIHGNNAIGKDNVWKELRIKLKRFTKKSRCFRSSFARDIYNTFSADTKNNDVKNSLYQLAFYKDDINSKCKLLFCNKYRGLIFKMMVLLNKV